MNNVPWSYRLSRWTWLGLDLLFPPVCAGCGKPGWRWCTSCQAGVPRIQEPFCERCGIPTRKGPGVCEQCRLEPPPYRMMRSWAVFDSPIQNGLHTLKYRRNVALGESLARQMAPFACSLQWAVDMLIPLPLGKQRFRERGYNQVALVAQPLAYEMRWPYVPAALTKVRDNRSQVGLTHSQRRSNVQNVYQADANSLTGKTVLIMDDVATTGSTITAATQALLSAGAKDVYVLTIARALAHHRLDRV